MFPDRHVVKAIHVRAGESLSLQRHREKHETQFYLDGCARIEYGWDLEHLDEVNLVGQAEFTAGSSITFEPGVWHRITAVTDVVFMEVQTAYPGWSHDIERREDRYGRAGTTAPSADQPWHVS